MQGGEHGSTAGRWGIEVDGTGRLAIERERERAGGHGNGDGDRLHFVSDVLPARLRYDHIASGANVKACSAENNRRHRDIRQRTLEDDRERAAGVAENSDIAHANRAQVFQGVEDCRRVTVEGNARGGLSAEGERVGAADGAGQGQRLDGAVGSHAVACASLRHVPHAVAVDRDRFDAGRDLLARQLFQRRSARSDIIANDDVSGDDGITPGTLFMPRVPALIVVMPV